MEDFLSLDESLKFLKEHSDIDTTQFKQSYYKSLMSGGMTIKASDGSDFASRFDASNMERVAFAIPSDFKPKQKVNKTFSETVTALSKSDILNEKFDHIAEEAVMLSCEDYNENDFLCSAICKELWKMGIKSETKTGWAYYSKVSIQVTKSKNRIVPIFARPFVSKEYYSSVVKLDYFAPVYLKYEFPKLSELSEFHIKKMTDGVFKNFISKIVKNNDPYCRIMIDRVSGKSSKRIIFYVAESVYNSSNEIKEILKITRGSEPLDFNFESYLEDNGNRIIMKDNMAAIAMLDELTRYLKQIQK